MARLLEDIVELVYMGYPLSVIRGLVHSLLCSRVAQIVAKLSERGFLFARIEWWMIRRISGRNLEMGAAVLVGSGLVAAEILVTESWSRLHGEEQFSFIFVLRETAECQGSAEVVGEV